jgi:cytochrome P450
MPSLRAILHNSDNYPEPDLFQPERYLVKQDNGSYIRNENVRDPKSVAFGFGRRICPGRFVADASLFASVISLLASVTFHCAQDAEGMDIIPKVETSSGFITHPEDFPYAARYRSEKARLSLLGEHALES